MAGNLKLPAGRYDADAAPVKVVWRVEEDLHTHTNFSDGTLSPEELLSKVSETSVKVVAVTDHDTTDGLERSTAAAKNLGLTLIPGVELTAELETGTEMHILGLFIRPDDDNLQSALAHLKKERIKAAQSILAVLKTLGVDISWEHVSELAGGAVGRPHIARAMLAKGYVESVPEAFEKYLGDGCPARVKKVRLEARNCLELIKNAGGVSVLAHPRTVNGIEDALPRIVSNGLVGIEVYAEKYQSGRLEYYMDIANQYGLIPSGGSDYHAFGHKNEVPLGLNGPPAGTAKALFVKAKSLHGSHAGGLLTGEL